jgi:hypothetical protein
MKIRKLNDLTEKLTGLERKLAQNIESRKVLDFTHHQKSVSVQISDCIGISVSKSNNRSYLQEPIKGMQMIILGAKKLYNGKIEELKNAIAECKAEIKSVALSIAEE